MPVEKRKKRGPRRKDRGIVHLATKKHEASVRVLIDVRGNVWVTLMDFGFGDVYVGGAPERKEKAR